MFFSSQPHNWLELRIAGNTDKSLVAIILERIFKIRAKQGNLPEDGEGVHGFGISLVTLSLCDSPSKLLSSIELKSSTGL